ncbi:hypothetical protein SDJN02_13549, partial [Cucurbita argyrosperma subsp. argyrosperma]
MSIHSRAAVPKDIIDAFRPFSVLSPSAEQIVKNWMVSESLACGYVLIVLVLAYSLIVSCRSDVIS